MSEPFVLEAAGGRRWIVGSPQDPHGDGYVQTVTTELHDDGMTASTVVKIDGQGRGSRLGRRRMVGQGRLRGRLRG
ncbi:hypothetical protein ACI2LC_09370 [Nonomuraea wenchangensis]|uniref:hypothetical protein n=1 Tax=Nonomuraea wenchangensis TaxID=568860 RepID=UPI00384A74CC